HPTPAALAIGTAVTAIIATLVGIPAATLVAHESGREDPGHVVIDEVAGQLIALIAIPADWRHAALSLLLFRLFDIFKPPPIRRPRTSTAPAQSPPSPVARSTSTASTTTPIARIFRARPSEISPPRSPSAAPPAPPCIFLKAQSPAT